MERDSDEANEEPAPQMALRSVTEYCSRLDLGTLPWLHQELCVLQSQEGEGVSLLKLPG